MHSKEKATRGQPDLGFDGAWDGPFYFCRPCEGWGAIVYNITNRDLAIQFFKVSAEKSLKKNYVAAVLKSANSAGMHGNEVGEYFMDVPDFLTITCIIHRFAEEHNAELPHASIGVS